MQHYLRLTTLVGGDRDGLLWTGDHGALGVLQLLVAQLLGEHSAVAALVIIEELGEERVASSVPRAERIVDREADHCLLPAAGKMSGSDSRCSVEDGQTTFGWTPGATS